MVLCLFSLLLLMMWLDRNRKTIVLSRNSNKQYEYSATNYITFFTCVLLVISALRAENIGIDTPSYLWVFMRGDYLGASLGSFSTETEVGFMLVQKICSITGIGFRGLIIICSIVAIKEFRKSVCIVLFLCVLGLLFFQHDWYKTIICYWSMFDCTELY